MVEMGTIVPFCPFFFLVDERKGIKSRQIVGFEKDSGFFLEMKEFSTGRSGIKGLWIERRIREINIIKEDKKVLHLKVFLFFLDISFSIIVRFLSYKR